jgi:hypothetical protein
VTLTTLDDFNSPNLGRLDRMGYDYEMQTLDYLKATAKENGFKITFHNPIELHLWKRTKTLGVDLVIEVKNADGIPYTLWIEESYQSHDYHYRKAWFLKCRAPRFRNVPKGRFNIPIIVTNKPHNMFGIRPLAKKHGIRHIFNLTALIDFINRIRNLSFYHTIHPILASCSSSHTVDNRTNNVYAYDNKIDLDSSIVSSNPVIRLLQEVRRRKVWQESLLEHGINVHD